MATNYSLSSGSPQARTLNVSAPQSGTLTLRVDPLGTIRLPTIKLMDFRVEKTFHMFRQTKLSTRLNIYNLMNSNTVTGRNVLSGVSTYLVSTSQLPPRIFEFSGQYSF